MQLIKLSYDGVLPLFCDHLCITDFCSSGHASLLRIVTLVTTDFSCDSLHVER